jgi:WD40 repeat protein
VLVEKLRAFSIDAAGGVIAVGVEGGAQILDPDGTVVRPLVAEELLFGDVVALSSDGRRVVAVSPDADGRLAIWDVATGALSTEQPLPGGFTPFSAVFADDGVVWVGGRDADLLPVVLRIDGTTGSVLGELRHSSIPGNGVTAIALSEDGRTLATGAMDRRISLWDADTLDALPGGLFTGHRGNVTGIVFWDGGDTLMSADDAGDVLLWDVSDRRQFARLGGPLDDVTSLSVDRDTSTLLASSEDGHLWTWNLDPVAWRDFACQLAGRNMTQAEWELYGDGGVRVRHCADLPAGDGDVRDADYGQSLID